MDAAADCGVAHLVDGSAGPGTPGTGVAAWDRKLEVADHARRRRVPLTVLPPMAFMGLMTDKDLHPPVATWRLVPRLVGEDRPLPWLAAEDLGAVAARVRRPGVVRRRGPRPGRRRCRTGCSSASWAPT